MNLSIFDVHFFFPSAKSVALITEDYTYELTTEDQDNWYASVPLRTMTYGYLVDQLVVLPDPYNSLYALSEGSYLSVLDERLERENHFPETPVMLFYADTIPTDETLCEVRSVDRIRPSQGYAVAVLIMEGLWRPHSSVVWLWQSPSGRRIYTSDTVANGSNYAFSALQYNDIVEYGTWSTVCFLNGRYCGTISTDIASLGYPSTLARYGRTHR